MSTTSRPTKNRSPNAEDAPRDRSANHPRVRASGQRAGPAADSRESQYDLLTAALLGIAVGAGTTLLLRQGPSGRPIAPAWRMAREGARRGARMARRGAKVAWKRGADAWDRLPREEIEEQLGEYVASARDAIENVVESELRDLRRALRRRRKKLGI